MVLLLPSPLVADSFRSQTPTLPRPFSTPNAISPSQNDPCSLPIFPNAGRRKKIWGEYFGEVVLALGGRPDPNGGTGVPLSTLSHNRYQ